MKKILPGILTIAGSDSGGGAGIQADLKTFSAQGLHGCSAITAVTAQNTRGVQSVYALAPEAVESQIQSVFEDIRVDSIKTGMLYSAGIVEAVARAVSEFMPKQMVIDPVTTAKDGSLLLEKSAIGVMTKKLFPLAAVVAPNIPEAETLTGMSIKSDDDRVKACRSILAMGPKAVLLKGGHAQGRRVLDFFLDSEGNELVFNRPRLEVGHTHGTGCVLSAAITGFLAKSFNLMEAVAKAQNFIHAAISHGYALGKGTGPVDPIGFAINGRNDILERLRTAWDILEKANPVGLIPEVQSNLAEALPGASAFDEVAAFPGRIVKCGERIRRLDGPRFGASRHMAKILLASAKMGSPFRAVLNIRFGADVLEACGQLGFSVESFNRADEPEEVKSREGSSLEWGTLSVLERRLESPPDVIYDEGDKGKEPMIRVFGRDAVEAAERVAALNSLLNR